MEGQQRHRRHPRREGVDVIFGYPRNTVLEAATEAGQLALIKFITAQETAARGSSLQETS